MRHPTVTTPPAETLWSHVNPERAALSRRAVGLRLRIGRLKHSLSPPRPVNAEALAIKIAAAEAELAAVRAQLLALDDRGEAEP